jgi:hypothetical protein
MASGPGNAISNRGGATYIMANTGETPAELLVIELKESYAIVCTRQVAIRFFTSPLGLRLPKIEATKSQQPTTGLTAAPQPALPGVRPPSG